MCLLMEQDGQGGGHADGRAGSGQLLTRVSARPGAAGGGFISLCSGADLGERTSGLKGVRAPAGGSG